MPIDDERDALHCLDECSSLAAMKLEVGIFEINQGLVVCSLDALSTGVSRNWC